MSSYIIVWFPTFSVRDICINIEPLSQEQLTSSSFRNKGEIGTIDFFLIKWPLKYFYHLRYYLQMSILSTFSCFGIGVLLFLSPILTSGLVVIPGLRLVSNCIWPGANRFSDITLSELTFIIYRGRDIGRFWGPFRLLVIVTSN